MDPKKIKAIVNWQDPESVTGLKSFLKFCNYYRKFIGKWLDKTELFIKITKKNKPWNWDNQKKELFEKIKKEFTKKPILKIYQSELLTRVKTNALDFALKACLLQKHNEVWHPVAYYSHKMMPPELNYDIYNKELLEIVIALKKWKVFLQSTKEPFVVKTDYKNLTSFLTTKELN